MLKKNNKGFTVVELIASFVFTSILAITLFAAVMNYKDKQTDSMISTQLLAFKSQLLMDIESDIQKKGLSWIEHSDCNKKDEDTGTIVEYIPRCVTLHFNDGDSKVLLVSRKTKIDELRVDESNVTTFTITYAYISYGGVQYRIPDEDNIDLGTDYFFEETEVSDGLETKTPLYRIRMDLVHKDLPQNIVISFVANGSKYLSQVSNPYNEYKIGDLITVRVGGRDKYETIDGNVVHTIENEVLRKFRVIRDSGGFEDSVLAIYDDPTSLGTSVFSNTGIEYNGSTLKAKIEALKTGATPWDRVKDIRPITYREVQYISSYCITANSDVNLANAPAWLTSSSYWTMSSNPSRENNVWYVDTSSKKMVLGAVGYARDVRPVIEVEKQNITRLER